MHRGGLEPPQLKKATVLQTACLEPNGDRCVKIVKICVKIKKAEILADFGHTCAPRMCGLFSFGTRQSLNRRRQSFRSLPFFVNRRIQLSNSKRKRADSVKFLS